MDNQYTWIPFYMELANKLRDYSDNRSELIQIITDVYDKLSIPLPTLEKDGMHPVDIDPFTVFGLFNKGIKEKTRIAISTALAEQLHINAEIPNDFNGIPILNPMKATFYAFVEEQGRGEQDIDNLWKIFIVALNYADEQSETNRSDFCKYYDIVSKQKCIRRNLTMGLFWIRPYHYLNLDSRNSDFLRSSNTIPDNVRELVSAYKGGLPSADVYLQLCAECKEAFQTAGLAYNSFPSMSYYAWSQSKTAIDTEETEWFPSLEEYTPGFSVEDWFDLLNNKDVFDESSLIVIQRFYEIGGQATCSELAQKYGNTAMHYSGIVSGLAKRIHKKTNCPVIRNELSENSKWWPILFVGKDAEKQQTGAYVWKLREELKAALDIKLADNKADDLITRCWFVGAYSDSDDTHQDEEYIAQGIWQNGYTNKFLDTVNSIKVGDKIAIKTSYTKKKGLPFDNHGETISVMNIKIVGTVTANHMDGRTVDVDWDTSFQPKEWYFYTFRNTITLPKADDWRTRALLDFVFRDVPQDYAKFQKDTEKTGREDLSVSNSEFLKYFAPLIQALKDLGSSATRKEAHEKVIELMDITEEELSVTYEKTGASRVLNQIDFARNDLAHEGFISSGTKGVWALTELGMNTEMTMELAGLIHMKWVKINTAKRKGEPVPEIDLSKYYKKKIDHKYIKKDFLNDVFITESEYDKLRSLILRKKNIILQGAPGVGKTFSAKRLAYSIIGEKNESRICMVQFHQNYSYEDFIMGYRPNDSGGFELQSGVFYNFCIRCQENPDKPYFFIIDEINRGNLSKIFGELLMLIETDKRGEKHKLNLVYESKPFFIPENLHIIGMMNTADRSLAMIDYALRRRFSFYTMQPAFENADKNGFGDYTGKVDCKLYHTVIARINELNNAIRKDSTLGKGFEIGHSYFAPEETSIIDDEWVRNVVEYEIIPLIEEYWFDNDKMLSEWTKTQYQAIGEDYDS